MSVFRLIETADKGIILFNLRDEFFEQVLNKSLIGKNGYLTLISPNGNYESKVVQKEYRLDHETLSSLQNTKRERAIHL